MFQNRVQIGRHSRWDTGGEAHSVSTRKKREFGCRPGLSPALTPSMPGPIRGIPFSRSCKTGIRVQPACLVWRGLATGSRVVTRQITSASERADAVGCRHLGDDPFAPENLLFCAGKGVAGISWLGYPSRRQAVRGGRMLDQFIAEMTRLPQPAGPGGSAAPPSLPDAGC